VNGVWDANAQLLHGVNMKAEPNTTIVTWNAHAQDAGAPVSIQDSQFKSDALFATSGGALLLNVNDGVSVATVDIKTGATAVVADLSNVPQIDSWLLPATAHDAAADTVYKIVTVATSASSFLSAKAPQVKAAQFRRQRSLRAPGGSDLALLVAAANKPPALIGLTGADPTTDDFLAQAGLFNIAFQPATGNVIGVIPVLGQAMLASVNVTSGVVSLASKTTTLPGGLGLNPLVVDGDAVFVDMNEIGDNPQTNQLFVLSATTGAVTHTFDLTKFIGPDMDDLILLKK
jgi:hypothetical protein